MCITAIMYFRLPDLSSTDVLQHNLTNTLDISLQFHVIVMDDTSRYAYIALEIEVLMQRGIIHTHLLDLCVLLDGFFFI